VGVDNVSIRRVTAADGARMRAIRLEMLADTPLGFLERLADAAARPHTEYQTRAAERATGPSNAVFLAECGPRVVGHAGGWTPPGVGDTTILYAVYVTPAHRGTGVVDRLVEAVAGWSREHGRPTLGLEVIVGNDRAIRAYERLGFTDTGKRAPHPTLPALTEMLMTRNA
jgi:ribosomal protein S18 acetylase RimI-like enzyme